MIDDFEVKPKTIVTLLRLDIDEKLSSMFTHYAKNQRTKTD